MKRCERAVDACSPAPALRERQFTGQSKSGLPRGGQWKCLRLAKISDVELREGPWRSGFRHDRRQACVEIVDLDADPASPYNPKRRLSGPAGS